MITNKPRIAAIPALRLCFTLLLMLSLQACSGGPSEDALKQQVEAVEAAVESGQSDEVMNAIAEDFVGPNGISRDEFRRLVVASMLGNRRIQSQTGPLEIKLQGDTARVNFSAAVSGSNTSWIPERGQVYQISTDWRYDDGDWLLIAARWEPVL
jgi:hypothetical protein